MFILIEKYGNYSIISFMFGTVLASFAVWQLEIQHELGKSNLKGVRTKDQILYNLFLGSAEDI